MTLLALLVSTIVTIIPSWPIETAYKPMQNTVLLHIKIAKGDKRGWGSCSGVYIAPHKILTAAHCVNFPEDMKILELWVKRPTGKTGKAQIEHISPEMDLALLYTDLEGIPAKIASNVRVNEPITVIGNPLGLQFVITHGYISGLNQIFDDMNWVRHEIIDAIVLPGNSGGPVFNTRGELLGIVVRSTSALGAFGGCGLGFAVQLEMIKVFLHAH